MTVKTAVEQMLLVEKVRGEGLYSPQSMAVGVARIGSDSQQIVFATMKELMEVDFGLPLHSLILPGDLHVIEKEMLSLFVLQ